MKRKNIVLALLLIFCFLQVRAKITLPAFFTSNMVLQQNAEVLMQGKGSPRNQIMLACSWDKNNKYAVWTDQAGNFKIKIKTPSYGGPYMMVISGEGMAIKLDNVMVGDVWLCSGQSNMEMPLAGWGKINDYQTEISEANYPNIRLLQVDHKTNNFPSDEVSVQNGGWNVCTPANVPEFSATAYFFAREVYKKTGIPIGLIHSSWGGTVAEAWTSAETISKIPDFQAALERVQQSDDQAGYEERISVWNNELNLQDKGLKSDMAVWANKSFDDTSWKKMELPAFFDSTEKPNFDGIVWFRKNIVIPQEWGGKDLILNLGTIDDNDITYFDGKEIGNTQGYDRERRYVVPKENVSPGAHTITVRVFDGGGGGGIYGDASNLFMQSSSQKQSLQGLWKYNISLDLKDFQPMPQANLGSNRPTVLYNAMIHPFVSFAIKGVIWYQGEANAGRAKQYNTLFPALIEDWRTKFNNPVLPFYFAQLACYGRGEGDPTSWPLLREAQLNASRLPFTGMAVTADIGDEQDIHPKNKQDVGKRLALIALAKTYGKQVDFSGPVFKSMRKNKDQLILSFEFGQNLVLKASGANGAFSIAGNDRVFYPASAAIVNGKVVLMSSEVKNPVAARYAWANFPDAVLTNKSGLPAGPFRTDDW